MFYDLLLLTISDPEKDKTSFLCSNRDRLDFDVGDATGFGTVLGGFCCRRYRRFWDSVGGVLL